LSLSARNVVLAAKDYTTLTVPCPACLSNLLRVGDEIGAHPEIKQKLEEIIKEKIPPVDRLQIKHPLDIIINDIGLDRVRQLLTKSPSGSPSLAGLKVAAYYGCLLTRPSRITRFDDPENPQLLDRLVTALGAESLKFPCKAKCCGGTLLMTNQELTLQMTANILISARDAGAQCIVTACPMCQMALETLYAKVEVSSKVKLDLPVVYFTQLMGLAFGFSPKELGLDKNLVSAEKLIATVQRGEANEQ
ncbi:CoB--CoM heterodisulfide reductase iron-sulfur subunit B family protein, partial [bacterium]|nr:CoB--CoM heterodisulfide reductase iron-sulfur subunit B family protein [bacterium]